MKKNDTWNIRRLVDDSFGPSFQQTSVIYCKLTDLYITRVFKSFLKSKIKAPKSSSLVSKKIVKSRKLVDKLEDRQF